MSDKSINDAVDFLYTHGAKFAEAKAHRVYLEEFRKSKKAILMKSVELSPVQRLRWKPTLMPPISSYWRGLKRLQSARRSCDGGWYQRKLESTYGAVWRLLTAEWIGRQHEQQTEYG